MTKAKSKYNFDVSNYVCQNEDCPCFREKNNGHVIFGYMGGTKRDTAYLKCKICGKYFSQNKGTFFYRRKKSRETISRALKSTVEGAGIRATARVFDLNKDTVLNWVKHAGQYYQDLEKKI